MSFGRKITFQFAKTVSSFLRSFLCITPFHLYLNNSFFSLNMQFLPPTPTIFTKMLAQLYNCEKACTQWSLISINHKPLCKAFVFERIQNLPSVQRRYFYTDWHQIVMKNWYLSSGDYLKGRIGLCDGASFEWRHLFEKLGWLNLIVLIEADWRLRSLSVFFIFIIFC